jgi:CRISPR-associated protein Cas1
MEVLTDLKAILHSKRANIYYLEMCRVMQKDGRILYLTEEKKENLYYNIPIANTTVILLGTGTSITQAAMRMLASAGVLVGFCGGGGTPLLMATEVEWMTPQSEYRPTEYLQGWMGFWFEEKKRLQVAKTFQVKRLEYLQKIWSKDRDLKEAGFDWGRFEAHGTVENTLKGIENAGTVGKLLQIEADLTKRLYKHAAVCTGYGEFRRDREGMDTANTFLNHGNYLAYGLAACCLWVFLMVLR